MEKRKGAIAPEESPSRTAGEAERRRKRELCDQMWSSRRCWSAEGWLSCLAWYVVFVKKGEGWHERAEDDWAEEEESQEAKDEARAFRD